MSAPALHLWLSSFVQRRLKLPISVNITRFHWLNSDIYCSILYTSVPLLATAYRYRTDLSQFHQMHAQSNYRFKEFCNSTCSNAIGQLCKIKSNSFCHSLIYRSVRTDVHREAPPISESVGRCCFYEAGTPATQRAGLQRCCIFRAAHSQRLGTPSSRFSRENCLCLDPRCSFRTPAPLQSSGLTQGTLSIQLQAQTR